MHYYRYYNYLTLIILKAFYLLLFYSNNTVLLFFSLISSYISLIMSENPLIRSSNIIILTIFLESVFMLLINITNIIYLRNCNSLYINLYFLNFIIKFISLKTSNISLTYYQYFSNILKLIMISLE